MEFDAIDRKLLSALQRDGRLTNVELADEVGLSPSPCLRRVRHLERDGVVAGYHARLDREAVGLGLTVFVSIKVERHHDEHARAFREAVRDLPEIVAAHIVSGEADFLLEAVLPSLGAYRTFLLETLLKLPGVKDIRSNFAIGTIKADGALPLGHLAAKAPHQPD